MVNGHSFIPMRQTAAVGRRALAEVCTVPMLLVHRVQIGPSLSSPTFSIIIIQHLYSALKVL